MSAITLYMPSTPLNLVLSIAHALAFKEKQRSQLWFIDQKNPESPYIEVLRGWEHSPFESVQLFTQSSAGESKLKHRRELFDSLDKQLATFTPNQVVVGSDRRIEFQFVMHCLAQHGQRGLVKGIYLDDGLYSYAGRPSVWYKDQINNLLKKIVYGCWLKEPKTIGASAWIDEAWLFRPEHALDEITVGKKVFPIAPQWFLDDALLEFSERVLEKFHFNAESLAKMDVLIFVAHPNNILKMPGYAQNLRETLFQLKTQGLHIALKYHPRSEQNDALDLLQAGADLIIPAKLASEFCLPALNPACRVIGDVGTALLTVRWIRPELKVFSILSESDDFQCRYVSLMQRMDVKVIKKIGEIINDA